MSIFLKSLLSAAVVVSSSVAASAAVTYVDAIAGGNTALAAGGTFTPGAAASGTDGAWRARAFGNGATIVEAGGDNGAAGQAVNGNNEDVARLVTTVTGLTPGQEYSLFTFFWDTTAATPQNWPIRSSLTNTGDLTLFDQTSPLASTLTFTTTVLAVEGDRSLRAASLGNLVADGAGQIAIYVDDDPAARNGVANGYEFRTWYDGVGYEAVPEPASIALLSMGVLAVARRRQR